MGFVGKIAKTTENPAIKYKSLKHSGLYLIFHRFSILFIDLITIHEVLPQEIALYKVTRSRNVEKLVREHNVRILEIDDDYIVVEKTGHKAETQALFRLLQPFGVQQFVRSGTVAIIKSRRELLNEYLEELERNRQRTDSF